MRLLYEILPVFLFFLAFKLYGIYVATVVGIAATFAQVVIQRLWTKQWDKKQLVTLAVFVLFGGMTLYFHDPIFVKWKPTIIFWIFALIVLASHFFTPRPVMQRLMEGAIAGKHAIPQHVWYRLNLFWAAFFIIFGTINLYVAYQFDNSTWVNFKFYGITSGLLVFSFIQAIYLAKFMELNRADIIRHRLTKAFTPTHIEVIDESDRHIGHAGHGGGGRHFAVTISAPCFTNMTRVEAHRRIYESVGDMMPETIHALRINII